MRPVRAIQILVLSLGLVGCTRPTVEPAPAARAPTATPAAPDATPAPDVIGLTCKFPLRDCLTCTGGHVCARFCPECPPPLSPRPDTAAPALAELTPVGEQCGAVVCRPGLHCCNPSCGTCVPRGVECTQQACF